MDKPWIRTFTGIEFDIIEPTADMVCIEDIAHALSLVCRWSGHVKHFYSVGQHSYLGSLRIAPAFALEFLLHDATEAYIGDMSRPLKHFSDAGKAYQEVEHRLDQVIRKKFELPLIESPEIYLVDDAMLLAEKEQLMPKGPSAMMARLNQAADVKITKMTPEFVEQAFLQRFYTLTALRREEQWVS